MIDIKRKYLDELTDIFSVYCPKAEIWAYGSRIKNESHSGSDLDLTVKDFNEAGICSDFSDAIRAAQLTFCP